MSLIKSLLLGSEGSYIIFGIPVNFVNNTPSFEMPSLEGAGTISRLAESCIQSKAFRLMTQGYTHVFVHEMGHALTTKALSNSKPKIDVYVNDCTGCSFGAFSNEDWKDTVICVAGPMADVAFANCKLVAATVLKSYLSWPVALVLGGGAVVWISGELLYAYTSAVNRNSGDFGRIARNGKIHLAVASAALVVDAALGIFAVIAISRLKSRFKKAS